VQDLTILSLDKTGYATKLAAPNINYIITTGSSTPPLLDVVYKKITIKETEY
jgi:hypothetical protein